MGSFELNCNTAVTVYSISLKIQLKCFENKILSLINCPKLLTPMNLHVQDTTETPSGQQKGRIIEALHLQ